jgi:uncharacterized membrane protein YkvA (DUF1232 family)
LTSSSGSAPNSSKLSLLQVELLENSQTMGLMKGFTQEQIAMALDAKSKHLVQEDLARIALGREAVLKIISEFPDGWQKARRQATLLFELIEAAQAGRANVSLDAQKLAAGALIYLSAPLDLVPDDETDGFADDAAIVSLALRRIEAEAKGYCLASGKNTAEFFD